MMTLYGGGKKRKKMKVVTREVVAKTGKARRFQAEIEPNGALEGETLIEELARYGYANERVRAELAMTIFEGFIVAKLAEGYRLELGITVSDSRTPRVHILCSVSCRARPLNRSCRSPAVPSTTFPITPAYLVLNPVNIG